jgi:hypothetical protein
MRSNNPRWGRVGKAGFQVEEAKKREAVKPAGTTADSRWLFWSSANLTEQAFTINMELGLLLTGGPLPVQVEGQFDQLIAGGVLEKVIS